MAAIATTRSSKKFLAGSLRRNCATDSSAPIAGFTTRSRRERRNSRPKRRRSVDFQIAVGGAQLMKAIKAAGKKGHIFVCSSTTTPGAVDSVLIPMLEKETGWKAGRDFGVCYNPEFIALGNVVNGLLEPDMVLIGESDPESGALLEELYRRYARNKCRIARMSIISAELTKISVNSYITMKISFTNQLRMIAEKFPKAAINMILDAFGTDTRIDMQ